MINYADKHHVYFNDDRVIYDSPTKILRKYKKRFDAKTASKAYAKKFGKTPEYWQKVWKEAGKKGIDRGNKIHNEREEVSLGRGVEKVGGKIRTVINGNLFSKQTLDKLPDGVYPELIVWNDGWKIAGRADKVVIETVDGVRYADIMDYKSNKEINELSYKDHNGNYKMMLPPVQHLMDTKLNEYTLQLSMYQYMLETHGFVPRKREIIHVPHPIDVVGFMVQPEDVVIPIPYLKDEVLSILEHYNKKRKTARYEPKEDND